MNVPASLRVVATLLVTLLGACSLSLDTDKKQCSNESDCIKLNSTVALTCESGLCVKTEGVECKTSAMCAGQNGKGVCNTMSETCVTAAVCETKDDCDKFDGFAGAECKGGSCGTLCTKTADCAGLGSGFTCEKGRCTDPKWGCLGTVPERITSTKRGSFSVELLSAVGRTPIVGDLKTVLVCSRNDPGCTLNPQMEPTYSLDRTSNILKVANLEPGFAGQFVIVTENYMKSILHVVRPVVGDRVEPDPLLLIPPGQISVLGSSAMVDVDQNKGIFIARAYDCAEEHAEGLTLLVGGDVVKPDGKDKTEVFYVDNMDFPDKNLAATNEGGAAGVVNLLVSDGRGSTEFSFQRSENGETLPVYKWTLPYLAGYVTYLGAYPPNSTPAGP